MARRRAPNPIKTGTPDQRAARHRAFTILRLKMIDAHLRAIQNEAILDRDDIATARDAVSVLIQDASFYGDKG
jgi:hypothetical protein